MSRTGPSLKVCVVSPDPRSGSLQCLLVYRDPVYEEEPSRRSRHCPLLFLERVEVVSRGLYVSFRGKVPPRTLPFFDVRAWGRLPRLENLDLV